jgi:disulfide bond formation protein DsbB
VLEGLVKDVKSAAASVVDQYLARASVAIPFIVAFGFATAALGLELTARFGAKNAFWMMAAGFSAVGVLAALFVTMREREAAAAEERQAAESSGLADIGEMASEAATQAGRLPLGLLAPLLASPSGSAMAAGRLLGRNMPLVLLLALIVFLFWPIEEGAPDEEAGGSVDKPEEPNAVGPEGDPWREAA